MLEPEVLIERRGAMQHRLMNVIRKADAWRRGWYVNPRGNSDRGRNRKGGGWRRWFWGMPESVTYRAPYPAPKATQNSARVRKIIPCSSLSRRIGCRSRVVLDVCIPVPALRAGGDAH